MEHFFIVNPAAGKGRAESIAEQIRQRFEGTSLEWRIAKTWSPGHATILAREAVANSPDIHIYSVGGDGTVNEIVNGIAGTKATLGVVPCGTGNDTIRTFSDIHDPLLLLESIVDARVESTDLGKINGRWFLNIASVGLDAEVVHHTKNFKNLPLVPGSLAYVLGVMQALIQRNTHEVTLSMDGSEPEKFILLLAAFANGRFYGGGLQPAPDAKMNDGLLNYLGVLPLSRREILRFFPLLRKGGHVGLKEVVLKTFRELKIESEAELPVNIDGELTTARNIDVSVHPNAILLKIP